MPSTYTTNGGIELPANGEQSGTWGETVNDNMAIIDRLTNGVGAISLSGTTHTLTTADGTLSDGQYNVLVLGGSPSGTNTITISPNDGEHVYIVKNASGQTATFTQGSGANVSVLNNTTKIIYADGAGAGAAVVDITGALDLGSLIIAGTSVTATAAELNLLDGSIAGTVVNSKAVIYGAAGQVEATTVEFDNLSGTGAVSVTNILDEDNMASDSATALATQQSIKAYVDAQVDTVDTLAEILAIGNTTGATDIAVDSAQKVQFRDAAIYINSSVDGQLDIVADTEIQIAATTVDLNGNLDVSGTTLVTGVLTTTAATVFNGGFASNADSTLGTDKKVQFRDAAIYINSSVDGQLDIVADTEIQIAATTIDVNGALDVSGTALVTGVLTTTAATVSNGGGQFNGAINVGVDDTGYDVKFFGATAGKYMLWDESADTLEVSGTVVAAAGTALLPSITTTGDLNTGMWFPAADTIAFSEGGVEALRIDSSGNVGIGTSSPTARLQLSSTGNPGLVFDGTNQATDLKRIRIVTQVAAAGDFAIQSMNDAGSVKRTNLYIDSSGNVGIGTTSPFNVNGRNLHVQASSSNARALLESSGGSGRYWTMQSATDGSLNFYDLTGSSEAMRLDSSGNVGIGTSSPATSYKNALQVHGADGGGNIRITNDTTGTGTGNGFEAIVSGIDAYLIQREAAPLIFYTSGAEAMRIDASGNLAFISGKGIDFSAVTGGTGTATGNVLDDYEEGSFSGVIAGSTTAGTFTDLANFCSYTKIGRQVTVQYYVQWASGTGTGNLLLTGLPFTSRNVSGHYYAGSLSYANVLRTANATPTAHIFHNSTQIDFLQIPTTDGDSTNIPYDAAGRLIGTHTYFTD
jgi:hypothetical protein